METRYWQIIQKEINGRNVDISIDIGIDMDIDILKERKGDG